MVQDKVVHQVQEVEVEALVLQVLRVKTLIQGVMLVLVVLEKLIQSEMEQLQFIMLEVVVEKDKIQVVAQVQVVKVEVVLVVQVVLQVKLIKAEAVVPQVGLQRVVVKLPQVEKEL